LSKLYKGKAYFRSQTFAILQPILAKPLVLNIKNVIGGGEQEWAAVEMTADSVCKNGMNYDQTYAWIVR
jgi:ketosteroid isomerase-like protein